jgi:hypothetical protein
MTPLETRLTDAPLANVELRDYDVSARARERAESDIVVALAGPEAQRTHARIPGAPSMALLI